MEITYSENFPRDLMDKMFGARESFQNYVFKNAKQGDVKSIIDVIDKFAWTEQWLMNVGDRKGLILDQAIQERKPLNVLELGTFLGYSSLRMIAQLSSEAQIVTIEADAESAAVAHSIHEYAGVSDRIRIVNDYTDKVIPQLKEMFHVDGFDLIFIDHYKDVYLRDFKLLEEYGLIQRGTVIVADNVITPGAPEYLQYIRNNTNYSSKFYEGKIEYREDLPDGVEVSTRL